MATFRTPLVTDEYYHIYNRGVARQPTFLSKHDYEQALLALSYYRFSSPPMKLSRLKELPIEEKTNVLSNVLSSNKSVEVISFVLMPNHFHLLLKQTAEKGISNFLSKFSNSYTKYFNTKHNRVGPVFQGVFKSVHIETNEQLMHISRYIHLNPVVSAVIKEEDFLTYPWSSMKAYMEEENNYFVDPSIVLEQFSSKDEYKKFVINRIDYGKKLEEIKHLSLD